LAMRKCRLAGKKRRFFHRTSRPALNRRRPRLQQDSREQ
jgi:hypothetical protein